MLDFAKQIEKAVKNNTEIEDTSGHYFLKKQLLDVMLDFPEKPEGFKVDLVRPKTYDKTFLVSGGADSTIMWELNKKEEGTKIGIYVDLGHGYTKKETEALTMMQMPHIIVPYELKFDAFWKHIIPTRNYVLLSIAEEYTSHEGEIWLGAVEGESANDAGDKSELFFRLFEELVWRTKRKKVTIRTLKDKTKNAWLKWYNDNASDTKGADILNTITCFDGSSSKPCGKCQACVRKWISMKFCGVSDQRVKEMFEIHPYDGGNEYIEKYKKHMQLALDKNDFTHYSKNRCIEDLSVIAAEEARRETPDPSES